jgi:hypothetical protein
MTLTSCRGRTAIFVVLTFLIWLLTYLEGTRLAETAVLTLEAASRARSGSA